MILMAERRQTMRILITGVIVVALGTASVVHATETTRDYAFDYAFPAAAGQIAPLRAWLEADKARMRSKIARDAASARADAKKDGSDFRRYDASKNWQVVTNTPRFLSLSGDVSSYTGGAHGNSGALSLLWDKRAGRRIEAVSVFGSPAAIQAAFGAPWCAWLRTERTTRTGTDAGKDDFFKCPPISDLTLLLGSSNGRKIDRIGLIADQYVAGSYAEGPYETTLPITVAVLRIVQPAYRADFALR